MKNTVIFSAPQRWGKTTHAEALKSLFKCNDVVDDWAPGDAVQPGALHLTHLPVKRKQSYGSQGIICIEVGEGSPPLQETDCTPPAAFTPYMRPTADAPEPRP